MNIFHRLGLTLDSHWGYPSYDLHIEKVTCKVEKQVQYMCSKTGDEGNIYAARQGMRVCNNTNMRNPHSKKDVGGVTHVSIVACPHACLAAYILPSSPSCCIRTALISCLAAYLLKKKKKTEKFLQFQGFTYVIVVVYFTTFESLIAYIAWPCPPLQDG